LDWACGATDIGAAQPPSLSLPTEGSGERYTPDPTGGFYDNFNVPSELTTYVAHISDDPEAYS